MAAVCACCNSSSASFFTSVASSRRPKLAKSNLRFLIRLQPASYALSVEVFDALDGEEISCNDKDHPQGVSSGQVNEAKDLTERNPGQRQSDEEHEQSADDDGRGRAAL